MAQQGWISIHRKIKECWIWLDNEAFDKRSAWIDLLLSANHAEKKILIGNKLVDVQKGQFIISEVKLAERWRWSRKKVRSFLKVLEDDEMIKKIVEPNKFTTIEIINYERYQNGTSEDTTKSVDNSGLDDSESTTKDTSKGQQKNNRGTTKEQQRNTNNNDNNSNNYNNVNKYIGDFTSNADLKEAIKDFIAMRKQIKKPMTDRAIKLLLGDLNKLSSDDGTKIEILNQSIQNCWKGIFPLKKEGQHGSNTGNNQQNKGKYAGIRVKTKEHNISESDYADLI